MFVYRVAYTIFLCVVFFSLLISTRSFAQETADYTEDRIDLTQFQERNALEEITVTARKREEKLQDVPVSISAFTAKGLRDRNIDDAYDLANFTPNFNFTKTLGRRLDAPNIRGQFGPLIGGTAPNASFFIDGVFVSGSIGSTSVANLERIEVLRGPQSTQFGRATFAGAVNYITRKPSDVFEGEVNAKYGEDGDQEIGGWISGPIVANKLFFYAGVTKKEWDGQWRNGLNDYDVVGGYSPTGYDETGGVTGGAPGEGVPYGQSFLNGGYNWQNNPQLAGDPPCVVGEPFNSGDGCAVTSGDRTELGSEETKIATLKLTWTATDQLEFNIKYERAEADDGHYVYLYAPVESTNNCYNRAGGGTIPSAGQALDPRAGDRSGGWVCGELTDRSYTAKLNIPHLLRGTTVSTPGAPPGFQTNTPAPFLGQQETIDRFYVDTIYDLADYTLTARYAHNEGESEYVHDLDRTYALGPAATGLFENYTYDESSDDSVEIRFASPGDRRLRWQAGYYYYDFEQEGANRRFNGFGTAYTLRGDGSQEIKNTAYFGDIEFDISDDLTFAFEGRYAKDEVSRSTPEIDIDPDPDNVVLGKLIAEDNFYSFSPRSTLSWNIKDDDTLTGYLQWAKGNKPGGFNFAYFDGDADLPSVDPDDVLIQEEKATTYEVGLKGTYLDGELTANLAVFYIDWTNQAINEQTCIPLVVPAGTCENHNIVRNAGKTRVKGTEFELNWFPTDFQSYTLAYGYTDSEIREYTNDEYAVLQCGFDECFATEDGTYGTPLTAESRENRTRLGNVSGNKAPRVPEHNLAISQIYQRPLLATDMEWFLRNDVIYESKKYSSTANLNWTPSPTTWNARLGLQNESWTVTWYIDNITDEKSPEQIQNFPLFDLSQNYIGPQVAAPPGEPGLSAEVVQNAFSLLPRRSRNTGITAQYRFGAR
jgi:outer membrane receptor protein involved in Fe transport